MGRGQQIEGSLEQPKREESSLKKDNDFSQRIEQNLLMMANERIVEFVESMPFDLEQGPHFNQQEIQTSLREHAREFIGNKIKGAVQAGRLQQQEEAEDFLEETALEANELLSELEAEIDQRVYPDG